MSKENKDNEVTINLGVAILIAVATVCSIGLLSLLIIKTGNTQEEVSSTIVKEREIKLADMNTKMAEDSSSYRVISKDKGTVQLPLDVAMEVTLKELQNQAPRPSGVPVVPVVAATPAPVEESDATAAEETTGEVKAETDADANTDTESAKAEPVQVEASE